jgi:hypothetical protein
MSVNTGFTGVVRFEEDYIVPHINFERLFEYLVDNKYLSPVYRDLVVNSIPSSRIAGNLLLLQLLLNVHIDNNIHIVDNMILKGLMATGQSHFVLKYFPTFIEKARKVTVARIYVNRKKIIRDIDLNKMITYIKDNVIDAPNYSCIRIGNRDRQENVILLLARRVFQENFDYNTDPFFKALMETDQQAIVCMIFPERNTIITGDCHG